jgi:enoyl-[acyl-carrier-protein] reductase (NADH)
MSLSSNIAPIYVFKIPRFFFSLTFYALLSIVKLSTVVHLLYNTNIIVFCHFLFVFAEVKEVSKVVLFLLSDHAGYVTGTENIVDGGLLSC